MATKRRGGTIGDMLRSLALVLAVIAVLAVSLPRHHYQRVHIVDYQHDLQVARQSASYHVFAPVGLSGRWRPTSSRVTSPGAADGGQPLRFHLGFVTPKEEYAGLEESSLADGRFVAAQTEGQRRLGAVAVAGRAWTSYAGDGTRSLVTVVGDARVVVTGTAPLAELTQLAAALR